MAYLYDLLIHENPDIYNSKDTVHNLNVFLSPLLFCFLQRIQKYLNRNCIFGLAIEDFAAAFVFQSEGYFVYHFALLYLKISGTQNGLARVLEFFNFET